MRRKKPLERRTYCRRLVRNTLLCLLLVLALWIVSGCPLPQAMALRRLERQNLLEPSTIVLETDDNQAGGDTLLLGVTEDHIHSFALRGGDGSLTIWERKGEEPTLVVLPQQVRHWTGEKFAYAPKLAAVDVPQAAVSARLSMTLTFEGAINSSPVNWEQTYVMEGVREGGCFLFQLTYQEERNTALGEQAEQYWLGSSPYQLTRELRQEKISYTLEFFDDGGQVILTQTNP